MQESDNVLRVLQEAKIAVKKEDAIELKDLSNQTIHTASIYQDADNIAVAVLIYSLSKIIERINYQHYRGWPKFFSAFLSCIDKAILALEQGKTENFREEIEHIRKTIDNLSGNFKRHIQEVFQRARINKASRIYEHGFSMEQTAKLLGISIWELVEYAGTTGIPDVNLNITLPIKKRITFAEEIFRA